MLGRVRELAVQYKNGTLSASDKTSIENEVTQLGNEISRIGSDTKFNGITLLSGTPTVTFQVGADDSQTIAVTGAALYGAGSTLLGRLGDLHRLLDGDDRRTSTRRSRTSPPSAATFGAAQNRLEHTLNNLAAYEENLSASESRIRDVDMASEMTKFTKYQILQQAGVSMLAQANAAPQAVLSLLR